MPKSDVTIQVLGTGGTVLDQLKRSIQAFQHLMRLELHNLFLDADDALGMLNSFVGCGSLKEIDAFNLTKEVATTIDPRLFPHLEVRWEVVEEDVYVCD